MNENKKNNHEYDDFYSYSNESDANLIEQSVSDSNNHINHDDQSNQLSDDNENDENYVFNKNKEDFLSLNNSSPV